MEEQVLPIVTFGKYRDKPVTELLADKNYVDWLKQQNWFSDKSPIYNIVVNQTFNTTNNSKTPEHNKLQNLFLDKSNQEKLLSKLFNNRANSNIDKINNILQNEDIIRYFGKNKIPEFTNNLDNTKIKFEYKFNWDLYIEYNDEQEIILTSILESELFDKIKYKEQYDIKENENYNNNLLLFDRFTEELIKFKAETANISSNKTYSDAVRKLLQDAWNNNTKIIELFSKCCANFKMNQYGYYYTIHEIYNIKKIYENEYIENYVNNFNKHYEKYRLQYYTDILTNQHYVKVKKTTGIENQYELIISICQFRSCVYCELKPTLSDDYPCVLRKLQTQMELTTKSKIALNFPGYPILLIESFTSKYTSKEQLITIFKQSNIKIIFTDELFETSNYLEIESVNTNKLIEKNKFLTDNLLQTQEKLLHAEDKINQLEEKIKQLEEKLSS
jgi:hypothetical protein